MCLQNTAGFSVDAWRHQRRAQMRRQTYPKTYQRNQKWNCVCVEFYAFFGSLGITPSRNLRRRFCNNKHNSTVVMDLHFTWKNWCLDVMLFGNALFGRNWVSIFQNQVQRFISLNICHSCCQLDTTLQIGWNELSRLKNARNEPWNWHRRKSHWKWIDIIHSNSMNWLHVCDLFNLFNVIMRI